MGFPLFLGVRFVRTRTCPCVALKVIYDKSCIGMREVERLIIFPPYLFVGLVQNMWWALNIFTDTVIRLRRPDSLNKSKRFEGFVDLPWHSFQFSSLPRCRASPREHWKEVSDRLRVPLLSVFQQSCSHSFSNFVITEVSDSTPALRLLVCACPGSLWFRVKASRPNLIVPQCHA